MTSTASQQNQNPAQTPAAPVATPSYASAAGANKKPTTSPRSAAGSHPPVVVGSSAPAAQNGKTSTAAPMNGRPNIAPAVPTVVTPPVARGSSIVNGGADHARKSSVTISANAPASHIANGGPAGGPKGIQFGFNESPAIAHSTPQAGGPAPIPIPGSGNPRIQSPAHSPSPIPQMPQQSGGGQRAPSVPQAPVTFGSFPGDNDRHMKQHNAVAMGQSPHVRRDSQASTHGEGMHGGPAHGRGGYQGQGRGGRGNFNPQYNNSNMGYPPNRNFSGPNAGRGGMQPYHQGRGGMQQFPNSPQPHRASPATTPAMPHVTPTMQPAALAAGAQPYHYPGMNPAIPPYAHQMQMGAPYGMPPPMDGYRMNYQYPPQPMNYHIPQPSQFAPAPHQGFVPSYGPGQPTAQPMSRNASQVSDRPASSTGPAQPTPAIAQGTPQQRPAQAAPAIVSSPAFSRPKKSAAIVIKDSEGKVVDLSAAMKAPGSPAPPVQPSKTPPAIVSTPTPPPKPSTPSHGRTDSASTGKTAEQVRNEFMNLVRKQADTPSETKAKEEAEAAKAAEEKAAADKAAEEAAAQEKAAAEKAAAEEKAKEEARLEAEKKAAEEAKAEEAKAKEKAEADAKAKAEAEAAAAEAAKVPEPKVEEKPAAAETEDEEMERMIREMEEEDARREKEQEEISARKRAEKEEEKKRADAAKLNSADNDKKLREQEAEMERLEEERERRRKEADAKGEKATSVSDLLSKPMSALKLADNEKATTDASTKLGAADKARSKPAALNLAPLKTTPVEAPQPSAALQSLRSARFLQSVDHSIYPAGIASPNPALNAAVQKKGKIFKYDAQFLLQFQQVFTEQPSEEFHRQIKVLIGDSDGSRSASARTPGAGSGRQNSRAGASSAFPSGGAMGQFGAAKTLPPGTTSEQRFAMSQGNTTRPAMGSMGGFNRGGAFPGGQMSRTPSSNAIGLPSPRTGSRRGGGGGSKRDFGGAKAEAQAAKTMPLTHGQDLKPITVSATGWKPSSVGNKAAQAPTAVAPGGHLDPGMVQRKVKAALNKMTPENFQKISDQILTIAAQSKNEPDGRTLRQVIQLTFEKATDEAHWASMYAKFCKCMLENMSADIRDESILDKAGNVVSGGALFRKYLLNRCQEEFERGWKIDLPQPKEGEDKKATEAALLSDEYYIAAAAKRRGLGLVQFIGELYKLGMLTERIMHECVRKLLEFTGVPDEAEIESLTKLLKTIGGNLDSTEKGRSFMSAYFARIDNIVHLEGLPSRLMFMLMDIIDLRKSGWVSKEANKGPKTLEEVRAEAEAAAAQKAAESARSHQRGPPGGGGGGRPMGGRGESRNFSYNNSVPNQVGMDDLRRLKGSSSRTSSQNPSFGPTSMFNSRSNSGRTRLGGPGGAFGRAGEDSGASSRTGTPPVRDRDSVAHTNAFGLLADTGDHPGSPPSAHASPALPKATLDTVAAGNGKKE
jgi:translation initiation factor 4G